MSPPAYAKISAELLWHRKLLALPEEDRLAGLGFFAAVCAVCQLYRNDGYVPREQLRSVTACPDDQRERIIKALVGVELLDEVSGGIQVHDYLGHNDSRELIEDRIARMKTGGQKGGAKSGKSRRGAGGKSSGSPPLKPTLEGSAEKSREEQRQGEKSQAWCSVCNDSGIVDGSVCENCGGVPVVP